MYNIIELKWNNKESYLLPLLHMPRLDLAANLFFLMSHVLLLLYLLFWNTCKHTFSLYELNQEVQMPATKVLFIYCVWEAPYSDYLDL